MPRAASKPQSSKLCPICEDSFRPQTFRAHVRKCERDKRCVEGRRTYARELRKRLEDELAGPRASTSATRLESVGSSNDSSMFDPQDLLAQPEIEAFHPLPDTSPPADVADDDKFKTEYHPNSRRGVEVTSSHRSNDSAICDPWWPCFNTRGDFVLSQLLSEGHISKELSDKFIKFIRLCIAGKEELTVTGVADIDAAWQRASSMLTPVSSRVVRA